MPKTIKGQHDRDASGRVTGGTTTAHGLAITWNRGPAGERTGATVVDLIDAAIDRLDARQRSTENSPRHELAIRALVEARDALRFAEGSPEALSVEDEVEVHQGAGA